MSKKILVNGIAIVEGTSRNGITYTSEELHKFAPTLQGRPILKDHQALTDKTIGLVEKSDSIENGKKVGYSGWVKEDGTGVVEKIKDGRVKEVSIGAIAGKLIKENEDDEAIYAKDLVALELSLTPTPGVVGTSLQSEEEYTDESIKEIISNYEKDNTQNSIENKVEVIEPKTESLELNKRGEEMVEEKVEAKTEVKDEALLKEIAELKEEVKKLQEVKAKSEIVKEEEKGEMIPEGYVVERMEDNARLFRLYKKPFGRFIK
jgi:hypothetical protein